MAQFTEKSLSGTSTLDKIKENPIPATLAGLGLGILIVGSFLKKNESGKRLSKSPAIVHTKSILRETSEKGRESKERLWDKAKEWAATASDYTAQLKGSGAERIQCAGASMRNMIDENPLAAIAIALAAGAALGFSLPQMRREQEFMSKTVLH